MSFWFTVLLTWRTAGSIRWHIFDVPRSTRYESKQKF